MRLFDMAENRLDPKGNKYHLFTDRKGKEEFMDKIKAKVSKEGFQPEVDISEICDQFYNQVKKDRDWFQSPESKLKKVFKKTLDEKTIKYKREQEGDVKEDTKTFELTKNEEDTETASQRRQRDILEAEKNSKTFIMDRFSLDQIGKAHK